MKRKPEWVSQTLRRIDLAIGNAQADLSGWELGFLESIKRNLGERGDLSDEQETVLLSLLSRERSLSGR
ncbi:hypothetical protein ABH975_000247 [Bradyrhizobium ottawaense]|uniref:hypothetical protein n=1 Tax=Bradyrhizobium ottawaense TaxID=931866 RepID=UPI0035189BFA